MKIQRLLFPGVLLGIALLFSSSSPGSLFSANHISTSSPYHLITLSPSENPGFTGEVAPTDPTRGEQIYKTKCIVCHQADGKGLPGAFPPLAGSDYLLADKVRAVAQALNGSNMEITVNKVKYTTPMPPQVDNKEDAVAVINYVLNNFGNKGGTVTLEEVKNVVINPRK
jgi:mono/diheme cytochrome c family protein